MCARLPAVGQVQVREGGQRGEAAQALIGQLPAVAGLQVLQRAQRRAVPQRLVASAAGCPAWGDHVMVCQRHGYGWDQCLNSTAACLTARGSGMYIL